MNEIYAIGKRLKDIRKGMGLGLKEVSSMTGVSKAMLSQIERSESMPTLITAWKIANGLRIKFSTLFEDGDTLYKVKNIDNMTPLMEDDGLVSIYRIFPFSVKSGFDVWYGIFKPGCNYVSEKHKTSKTEHMIVFQGELKLVVDRKTYHLKAGSAIAFDAKRVHKYTNKGEVDAIVGFIHTYE